MKNLSNETSQLVNIKRVSVDSELKASVIVEFIASDERSKENIFSLIRMQGEVAEMSIRPAQRTFFEEEELIKQEEV